jgi:CHAT domain-containing protein/tetratricopeptide (TPR) repeat protein
MSRARRVTQIRWLSVGLLATVVALILLAGLAAPVGAQEARWKDLNQKANELQERGKYDEGISVAEEAVRVAESTFGADDTNVAVSLNLLAMMYDDQEKYVDAEPLFKRSLAIVEKALGRDDPEVASALSNLATLYLEQDKFAEAEPLAKRSLAIREKTLAPDNPDVASGLEDLSEVYEKERRYAESEALAKRSLAIREKTLEPDDPGMFASVHNLALLYLDSGRYAEAEPFYQRSLAIRERVLGPDDLDVAVSLDDLAAVYVEEGKYAEAEPLAERGLAIREKALKPDDPGIAVGLNRLALIFYNEGKYAEAEPLLKRGLAIREMQPGQDSAALATILSNIAALYNEQGKFAEAESVEKRSLAIREKILGPDDPGVAASLNILALLYENQQRYAEAEPLYKRSLAILEKALGSEHPDVAGSLHSLAYLYQLQGKYAEAEALDKRSLAIREKDLGPDHPDVAATLHNLALLYVKQGKYSDAEALFKRSLAILEKVLGPDHRDVAVGLNNLAGMYYAEGNYAEAEIFFGRGLQNLSRQFENSFTYMSEKDRLEFLGTAQPIFDEYFSFCLNHYRDDPELVGKMFDLLLWAKGMVGTSVAALRARVAASGDAEALGIFDRLAAKKSELARLMSSRPEGWEERRKSVAAEADDLEQELARRVSSLAEQKSVAHVSWREVQTGLKPGEAAVEIVSFPFFDGKNWTGASYYVALILTAQNLGGPTLVSLGEAKDLEADPLRDFRLRVGLRANGSARGVHVKTEAERIGQGPNSSFYEAFWKPLESGLKGVERIYISPEGVLNQVVLGDATGGDGRLLMEKYDLRIVSSTKDILRGVRKPSSNTAVLVGNPAFNLDEEQERAALGSLHSVPAGHSAAEAGDGAGLRSRDLKSGSLDPLPGTQVEVETVSSLLEKQHWEVQSFTRQRALKEAVMEVKGPRVLHLATHGFFEPDQRAKSQRLESDPSSGLEDPMLRSGLFFAGANRQLAGHAAPGDLDDGILTAYEATQLNLQGTELVVLSACDTGLGEVASGEGVFGLRRALQVAGAESVLMSMWAVPDRETQELMALFYTKWLAGKDKHEALREAQLEMRDRVKARYGKDLPQYWGAFVLVGR